MIENNQVYWLSSYHRDDPCVSIEKHFESAKENLLKNMNFVGIFEDLENSINILFKMLHLECPQSIPHLQTVDTDYQLTNDEYRAILERNKYDYLLYEFAKNLYCNKYKNS